LKIQLRSKTGFYFYVIVLDFYYVSIAIKKCTGSLDFICCLYFDKSIHIFGFYTQYWWSWNVVYFGILFLYLPVFFLNKLNFTFHVAASALEFLFHCPRGSWLICCSLLVSAGQYVIAWLLSIPLVIPLKRLRHMPLWGSKKHFLLMFQVQMISELHMLLEMKVNWKLHTRKWFSTHLWEAEIFY
jgi:hypothetical protein